MRECLEGLVWLVQGRFSGGFRVGLGWVEGV